MESAPPPPALSPQLHMRRPDLADLPPLPDPGPEYALRVATSADRPELARMLTAAYPDYAWTEDDVSSRLFDDQTVETTFVVEHLPTGQLVATASARLMPQSHPGAGYVHWVGADPAHRGRGFGRLCTLATMHRFVALGCGHTVLDTDDFRIPAIRIYVGLGYRPEMTHENHPGRWAKIVGDVGL